MALIIEGKMPKGCFDCDYCDMRNYFDGNEWHCACLILRKEVSDDGDKDENCPIVGEIPDEHGDLYDKKDVIRVLFHTVEDVGPISDWTELMAILDDIPVVVEASK